MTINNIIVAFITLDICLKIGIIIALFANSISINRNKESIDAVRKEINELIGVDEP